MMKSKKRKTDAVVKFKVEKTGAGKYLSWWGNGIFDGDDTKGSTSKRVLRVKEWYEQEVPLEAAVS